jgi:hypothetical protein
VIHGHLIPAWIMEGFFWLAIAAIVAALFAVIYGGLRLVEYADRRNRTDNPGLAAVPEPIYRIAELRESLDPLFIKLYGRAVEDHVVVRIDRALGRATVSDYRRVVTMAVPNRSFAQSGFFVALARDAAAAAELCRRPIDTAPGDVLELKKRTELADRV